MTAQYPGCTGDFSKACRISDAQKQEIAEILGNMAMLDMFARKRFLARHESKRLVQLEVGVRGTLSKPCTCAHWF